MKSLASARICATTGSAITASGGIERTMNDSTAIDAASASGHANQRSGEGRREASRAPSRRARITAAATARSVSVGGNASCTEALSAAQLAVEFGGIHGQPLAEREVAGALVSQRASRPRARDSRERTVLSSQPQMTAASAYERSASSTSTSTSR